MIVHKSKSRLKSSGGYYCLGFEDKPFWEDVIIKCKTKDMDACCKILSKNMHKTFSVVTIDGYDFIVITDEDDDCFIKLNVLHGTISSAIFYKSPFGRRTLNREMATYVGIHNGYLYKQVRIW